ncbi:MAG: ATP-binding cassette domain-containing protein [Actinobacteria bacterium]|nr:MAG: ATP-binding cassette domain-containing protein [Actinomycetota bacterium]
MRAHIGCEGVGVRFQLDRARNVVTPAHAKLVRSGETVWGLESVTLDVKAGEAIALVGPSGSGKTTLLRVLAGVLPADRGTLEIRGRVGSLLAIDAGLLSRLTGEENAQLLAVLAGMTRREAAAAMPRIREVSGLGAAFDRPVSAWSQGMRARIGFAVADCMRPDVLLLDEVHEALDHEFRAVIEERAHALKEAGGIVVAAGHDHGLLERVCERAVLMRDGIVVDDGPVERVATDYVAAL